MFKTYSKPKLAHGHVWILNSNGTLYHYPHSFGSNNITRMAVVTSTQLLLMKSSPFSLWSAPSGSITAGEVCILLVSFICFIL